MLAAALLTLSTIAAPEADQGVASDRSHVYAIDNYAIGKYDKASGKRVAGWEGDSKMFPHLNSCAVVKAELACAASNYPQVYMARRVEIFDEKTLRHSRTVCLGPMGGSRTRPEWHGGHRDEWRSGGKGVV